MGQANNGLAKIELGAIGIDGAMGTTLASLGFTEEDSAKINFAQPTKKEYFNEETEAAWFISQKAGAKAFTFTIANPDTATLVAVFGGTTSGTGATAVYKAPLVVPTIEQSLKITPKIGLGFNFPRVLVTATFTDAVGRNAILGLSITCDILQPTKALEPIYSTFQAV